jgi:anti-sigma factor RsiW
VIDPHDMMCQELVEVLTEYLDATLGAHDRARLEAHLTICHDCREYVAQFQRTVVLTGRADSGTLAPALREELRSAFRTRLDESGV